MKCPYCGGRVRVDHTEDGSVIVRKRYCEKKDTCGWKLITHEIIHRVLKKSLVLAKCEV